MRTAIVPAQVTTIEDRVAGNLNMTQLILVAAPLFVGAGMFIVMPPYMNLSWVKILLVSLIAITFLVLAVRIHGRLILQWVQILGAYSARATYVVYDSRDSYLRLESSNDGVDYEPNIAVTKPTAGYNHRANKYIDPDRNIPPSGIAVKRTGVLRAYTISSK